MRYPVTSLGEDRGYLIRAFLLYDGIHYDPLVVECGATCQGVFPTGDDSVVAEALHIASEAFKVAIL